MKLHRTTVRVGRGHGVRVACNAVERGAEVIALAPPIVTSVRDILQRHYVPKANDGVGKFTAVKVGDPVSGRQVAVPSPDVIVATLRCERIERDAWHQRVVCALQNPAAVDHVPGASPARVDNANTGNVWHIGGTVRNLSTVDDANAVGAPAAAWMTRLLSGCGTRVAAHRTQVGDQRAHRYL